MLPGNIAQTSPPSSERLQVLAVDSYGTLFDVKSGLAKTLTGMGVSDPDTKASQWVERVHEAMQQSNASGLFKPFPDVTGAALRDLSVEWSLPPRTKLDELAGAWRELDTFPDVKPVLHQCQYLGIPVWVVTNGDLDGISALLDRNGLSPVVNGIMTAEAVGRFKPASELYLEAASAAGTLPAGMVMASALPLDVDGAVTAGCHAVYIRRDTEKLEPQSSSPFWTVNDFQELVDLLQPLFARPAGGGEVF